MIAAVLPTLGRPGRVHHYPERSRRNRANAPAGFQPRRSNGSTESTTTGHNHQPPQCAAGTCSRPRPTSPASTPSRRTTSLTERCSRPRCERGGDLYGHPLGGVAANLLDLFALWRFCRSPKSRERHPVARMECATWLRRDALLASQGSSREVIHGPTAPPRAFYDSHMPQASSSRESVGMPTTSFWALRSLRRTVRVPTRQPTSKPRSARGVAAPDGGYRRLNARVLRGDRTGAVLCNCRCYVSSAMPTRRAKSTSCTRSRAWVLARRLPMWVLMVGMVSQSSSQIS